MRELNDLFKPGTIKIPHVSTHRNSVDRSARANRSSVMNSARSGSGKSIAKEKSYITFGDMPDSGRRSRSALERARSFSQSMSRDISQIIRDGSTSVLLPKESHSFRDTENIRISNVSLFSPRRSQTQLVSNTHREITLRDDNTETYRQAAQKYPRATAILKNIIHGTPFPEDHRVDTKAINLKVNRPFVSQVMMTESTIKDEPGTHRNKSMSHNHSAWSSQVDFEKNQSNKIAQMIVNGRNEPKSIIHHVPKFTSHLKSLSKKENSIYNRSINVDKAKILTNRVKNLPPIKGHEDLLFERASQFSA